MLIKLFLLQKDCLRCEGTNQILMTILFQSCFVVYESETTQIDDLFILDQIPSAKLGHEILFFHFFVSSF